MAASSSSELLPQPEALAEPTDVDQALPDSSSANVDLTSCEESPSLEGLLAWLGEEEEPSRTGSKAAQDEEEPAPAPQKSVRWPASLGASMSSLKSGWQATKEAYQARKEEVQGAVIERSRQLRHKSKHLMLDVKEQCQEKKNDLVQKVMTGIEGVDCRPPERQAAEVTQRWWAHACAAAHRPHDPADDPPAPPPRARTGAEPAPADEASSAVLGCLEVEVLHFSGEPPLTRRDGNLAVAPLCQLSLGSRCTGALRPQGAGSPPPRSASPRRQRSERPVASSGGQAAEVAPGPSEAEAGEEGAAGAARAEPAAETGPERQTSSARFAVDEILGGDLRVHVFDGESRRFSMGMEESAFCGGAFVPLASVVRRHHATSGTLSGLLGREFEVEMAVALLPLEAVRMARKLSKAEATGLERPAPKGGLGHVLLRLRLTVHDWVPAWMFLKLPYRGECAEVSLDGVQVDNPMSVLKAVGRSVERTSRALHPSAFLDALERLRERPATAVLLLALWSYTALLAPVWKVPGCIAAGAAVLAAEIRLGNEAADPPRLFKDELGEESDLSRVERTKKHMTRAVKMELRMMRFARTLTTVAIAAEKLCYILTLQDPQLSLLLCSLLGCGLLGLTLWLRVAAALLGSWVAPIGAWACGTVALLPAAGRAQLQDLARRLIAKKQQLLGRGRLWDALRALWRRIPDSLESQHCELAERYVLAR